MAGGHGPSQVVVGATGYSFARYIPPTTTKPEPTTSKTTPTVTRFDDEASASSPKRKRDDDSGAVSNSPDTKKAKKSKRKGDNGVEAPRASEEEPTPKDGLEEKQIKRTRRGKKRRSTKAVVDDAKPEDDSDASEAPKEVEKKADEDSAEAKPKRSKKEKRDSDEQPENDAVSNEPEPSDIPMVDAPDQDDPKPAKEDKKKRKKEKKRKEESELPDEDTTKQDAIEERHKTVMDRKIKSLKLAEETAKRLEQEEQIESAAEEPAEFHELGPLPQPAPAPVVEPNLTYETLPPWLAAPIRVSQSERTPFSEIGILPKAARVLQERGYVDAFAVQTAAIPLLLPTSKQKPGDLLISAATGSGKTLAYALPIARDISQGFVTRLRSLVVLPTRELVKQAQEVFELCAKAYDGGDRKRVRIGVAVGSQTLKSEQESLVESHKRYDPTEYRRLLEEVSELKKGGAIVDTGLGHSDPRLGPWEGEVVDFSSKVDVLICTPGRLVEHLEQTPGFDLDYVRWLIVDEADKLLAQSFQGWLDIVLERFQRNKFTAREFPDMDLDGVRKVVLSATLTRDLSLLSQLALRRPQLIVLESDGSSVDIAEHHLPAQLEEFAIRVHDTNHRPLYLLGLLQSAHIIKPGSDTSGATHVNGGGADAASDTSSDDTSSSDSDSGSETESGSQTRSDTKKATSTAYTGRLPTMLIFTKSNETALRLSRLLTLLDPSLKDHINTLTSTTPTHIRRKTLRAFASQSSAIRLIVASDLVARGIDIPSLDHVVNYDLPPSVAGYVHRVGRTARAGRSGRAWTLVDDGESGWFWGKIAKSSSVRRAQKVGRVVFDRMEDDKVQEYEAALDRLGQEALAPRKKR
jgi:ATP-dependent RNA helicase DDX51/DBP6